MLMHYTSEKTVKGSKFQQFGQKAVEQRVLKVIADVTGEQTFQVSLQFNSDRSALTFLHNTGNVVFAGDYLLHV